MKFLVQVPPERRGGAAPAAPTPGSGPVESKKRSRWTDGGGRSSGHRMAGQRSRGIPLSLADQWISGRMARGDTLIHSRSPIQWSAQLTFQVRWRTTRWAERTDGSHDRHHQPPNAVAAERSPWWWMYLHVFSSVEQGFDEPFIASVGTLQSPDPKTLEDRFASSRAVSVQRILWRECRGPSLSDQDPEGHTARMPRLRRRDPR